VPVGPARLVTLAGLSVAKYALLTSREIGADDAHRWALVHKIAPAASAEEVALRLAGGMAELDPEGVARLKRMLHEHDGVVERSAAEGRGQVEWQRTGPGLPHRG
jgi:enoyl-CoA hydratase